MSKQDSDALVLLCRLSVYATTVNPDKYGLPLNSVDSYELVKIVKNWLAELDAESQENGNNESETIRIG